MDAKIARVRNAHASQDDTDDDADDGESDTVHKSHGPADDGSDSDSDSNKKITTRFVESPFSIGRLHPEYFQ